MLGLPSGSIGLLSLLLLVCTQPQTTSHQLSQLAKSRQKLTVGNGLSGLKVTVETRVLYVHLQNIKQQHTVFNQQDARACGFTWNGGHTHIPFAHVKDVTYAFPALLR